MHKYPAKRIKLGPIQQKIILLLQGGLALGLSYSPRRQFRIVRGIGREWKQINQRALSQGVLKLYQSKLVEEKHFSDGSIRIVLNENGIRRALSYKLDEIQIAMPTRWDHKWRMVLFDVPESRKDLRDTFRQHLKRLHFYEFQKSVFIYPFRCSDEINFIIEFYHARKYVRFAVIDSIDNTLDLQRHFRLL
ncbi:MAG TPA: hypothetical protein VJK04_01195 [Candidatus Paceibacterota bacterium]